MKLPQLALFDLDGTLVQFPREFLFHQAEEVISKLELPRVERREMEEAFAEFDFFRWVLPALRETFMETYWELFDWEAYPSPVVIPGAVEAIKSLHDSGVKLAIVTSRHETAEDIAADLSSTGLLSYFPKIFPRGGDDAHWYDKSLQIRQACSEFGIDPKEAMIVGDIPPDVTSARSVGVGLAFAVLSGGIREHVFSAVSPDGILRSVTGLGEVFAAGSS